MERIRGSAMPSSAETAIYQDVAVLEVLATWNMIGGCKRAVSASLPMPVLATWNMIGGCKLSVVIVKGSGVLATWNMIGGCKKLTISFSSCFVLATWNMIGGCKNAGFENGCAPGLHPDMRFSEYRRRKNE